MCWRVAPWRGLWGWLSMGLFANSGDWNTGDHQPESARYACRNSLRIFLPLKICAVTTRASQACTPMGIQSTWGSSNASARYHTQTEIPIPIRTPALLYRGTWHEMA